MRLHYLQHVDFEGLGSIENWTLKRGVTVSSTRLFDNESLPSIDDFDLLVIMGGPMNIYQDSMYPWLPREKSFIRNVIEKGKHILGICLGAQLIADSLGAKVIRNKEKEIGFFPIQLDTRVVDRFGKIFPDELEVMHWHGDTFDLPQECTRIASSKACENQGFVYKDNIIALQFHLEMTEKGLHYLVNHCSEELTEGPFVQPSQVILERSFHLESLNRVMDELLYEWAREQ